MPMYGGGGSGGSVTSVATGTGLTGGPVTSTGTISLASIADKDVLANTSGSSAAPIATTLSALIDSALGSTQGQLLYRSASAWSVLSAGTNGQFLKTLGAAANPAWADVAGGASTADHFLVGQGGQNDTDLSNKVVIPGISASPDIRVSGTNDDEFDSSSLTGWTTWNSPNTVNANTAALSHLYIKRNQQSGNNFCGIYKANPSMPFTVTAKVSSTNSYGNNNAGIFVGEATPGKFFAHTFISAGSSFAVGSSNYTNVTTWSSNNTQITPHCGANGYLRLVVNSSTSIDVWYSADGLAWVKISNNNPGFTVGSVGLLVDSNSSNANGAGDGYFDWIRFS